MGLLPRTSDIVYRRGTATPDNFTPRVGRDMVGAPGSKPGLSVMVTLDLSKGEKAQKIDLRMLESPLQAIPDDPKLVGGIADHVSILPIQSSGNVDQELLEQWAASRGSGSIHRFTANVRDAIVEEIRG